MCTCRSKFGTAESILNLNNGKGEQYSNPN